MTERLSQIAYDELPAEVRPLADDILKVSSAALGGPYNALLRSPEMARRAFDFLDYLRFKTSVDKRLNEFAILIQARISNAQYEWWAHETIARKAGLSDAVMRDLQQCQRPSSIDPGSNPSPADDRSPPLASASASPAKPVPIPIGPARMPTVRSVSAQPK